MKNRASTEYRDMLRKNLAGVLSELRETCVANYTDSELLAEVRRRNLVH